MKTSPCPVRLSQYQRPENNIRNGVSTEKLGRRSTKHNLNDKLVRKADKL